MVPGTLVGRPTAQITAVPVLVPLDDMLVKKPGFWPLLMGVEDCCVSEAGAATGVTSAPMFKT